MIEIIRKELNSFLSAMKTIYSQPGQTGAKLVPVLFVLVICCLCSLTLSVLRPRNSPVITPSPSVFSTLGTPQDTPTSLFNFGGATFTPFPTLPVPTPFPTFTPSPPSTETATQIVPTVTETPSPTATATPIPTDTNPPPTVTATPTSNIPVVIIALDKVEEYAEIQNVSNEAVNLRGWRLVSEVGDQSCNLRGTLDPNEVLRIWSRRGSPGFDCRLGSSIWRDNEDDPAVLYNPQGEEVSRFP